MRGIVIPRGAVLLDIRTDRSQQCIRLGHTWYFTPSSFFGPLADNEMCSDYNPRLSFRDDTPRVVERMREVSTAGSTVWDCM